MVHVTMQLAKENLVNKLNMALKEMYYEVIL